MLKENPDDRPRIDQMLCHPFLTELINKAIEEKSEILKAQN